MSIPRPRVDAPPLAKLRERLLTLGLPPVVSCKLIAPPWVHANYRLTFPKQSGVADLLLRRRVSDPGYDTFAHELAALSALRSSDLPVVRSYRILPPKTLPWDAVLSDLLPGNQGFAVIRRFPEYGPHIARTTGEVAVRLAAEKRPTWGTAVDAARFVPIRDSWREEWSDRLWGWWTTAQRAGTDLGPVGARFWDALQQRLPVLDSASEWSVVHGDLHPSNVLFGRPEGDEMPPLVGVVDFEGAICGDTLIDWTLMTEVPDAILGHILTGIGLDRVHAVLEDPDALERLEVYHASRAIRRLAFASISLFIGDGGVRRSFAMHTAHRNLREIAERSVADKLRAALALGVDVSLQGPEPKTRPERVVWQALDSHRFRAVVDVRGRAALCAGALAAALSQSPSESFGAAMAPLIGPQRFPVHLRPIPDREAWVASLVQRVVARPDRPLAAVITALTLEGLYALGSAPSDWPVPDDTLAGLDVLVRQLHADELPNENAVGKLLQHVFTAAALRVIERHGGNVDDGLPAATEALRMAWEDLTLFGEAPKGSIEPETLRRRWDTHPEPERPKIPIALWALEQIDDLPAEPARILGAMGLAAPPPTLG